MPAHDPRELTPVEFERFVRGVLDQEGARLKDYQSAHLETIEAHDGKYEFDVTARFEALGADFLVVVECKRWAAPIEREQVQALEQKRQSVHAHKAILFSTSEFRRGAVEFAEAHGIALAQIKDGGTTFIAKSYDERNPYKSWLPACTAWLVCASNKGVRYSLLGSLDSPIGHHSSRGSLLALLRGESEEG